MTFTIDGIEFDKRLVSVEYYYIFNSDCDYNEETGEYSFTMPGLDTPVTIVVEQLTDVSKDGAISWRGNQPSQIVPGDSVQELTFNVNASWTTSCTVKLTSTDENVIPPSALTYKELYENNSNAITGITISIDLSQIKPGKTYLIVNFQSGNTSAKRHLTATHPTSTFNLLIKIIRTGLKLKSPGRFILPIRPGPKMFLHLTYNLLKDTPTKFLSEK